MKIIGSHKKEINKIKQAINFVKNNYTEYYDDFRYLTKIVIKDARGYNNEYFAKKKMWEVNKSIIIKNDIKYLASLLIHETYHGKQYYEMGKKNNNREDELAAYEYQIKFLNEINYPNLTETVKFMMKQYKEHTKNFIYYP